MTPNDPSKRRTDAAKGTREDQVQGTPETSSESLDQLDPAVDAKPSLPPELVERYLASLVME